MKNNKYWLCLAAILMAAAVLWIGRPQLLSWRHLPGRLWKKAGLFLDQRPRGLGQQEKDVFRHLSGRLDGLIVWASNRSGNHEIYLFDLSAGKFKQLTRNPLVDCNPKFSPDGRSVLFLRSQRPGLSFREPGGWDAYIFYLDQGREKLVAREVLHPTFGPAGRSVVYQRKDEIFQQDLATGQVRLLAGRRAVPALAGLERIFDPVLSEDKARLLLGFSGPPRGIGVLDLANGDLEIVFQGLGCQNTWGRNPGEVIWIGDRGRGKTSVMFSPVETPKPQILIDLPGDHSHEYFPRLSNDGRWLVWGASRGGHEHDLADYEIFLWAVDEPWSEAIRLTFDPGNDQWPDLWLKPAGAGH